MKPVKELAGVNRYATNTTLVLCQLLADQYVLSLQTLNCYWQMQYTGHPHMKSFWKCQFDKLEELMESVMGRIESFGHLKVKGVNDFRWLARLSDKVEQPGSSDTDSDEMFQKLLCCHQTLIELLNEDIHMVLKKSGDHEIGNFLHSMKSQHSSMATTLRTKVLSPGAQPEEPSRQYSLKQRDIDKLYEARELIRSQVQTPPSLPQLARMVGLNEFKLKKGFREVFQTTVYGYLNDYRLENAQQMILEGKLSFTEISYELGYSSPQHFSQAFRKKFGVSPKEFKA